MAALKKDISHFHFYEAVSIYSNLNDFKTFGYVSGKKYKTGKHNIAEDAS